MSEEIRKELITEITEILKLLNIDMQNTTMELDRKLLNSLKKGLWKEWREKIIKEFNKQEKMKQIFRNQLNQNLPKGNSYQTVQPNILLNNMRVYYILTTAHLISDIQPLSRFTCIFDQNGNLMNSLESTKKIVYATEESYYILDHLEKSCIHMKYIDFKWKQVKKFWNVRLVEKINNNLINIHTQNGTTILYNQKRNQIIIKGISELETQYPNFNDFEKNRFYLIEKMISTPNNNAIINFLVDLEGNLASNAIDSTRNIIYPIDRTISSKQFLKETYRKVYKNLQQENKHIPITMSEKG